MRHCVACGDLSAPNAKRCRSCGWRLVEDKEGERERRNADTHRLWRRGKVKPYQGEP